MAGGRPETEVGVDTAPVDAAFERSAEDPLDPIGTPRPTVGVLFVHGAGDHGVGATLTEFGQPLIAWLNGWLADGRPAGETQASDHVQPGAAQILVREADRSSPAHVAVEIRSPADREPHRWLLAESRWDQAFTPPAFSEVLTWALTVVPWTVFTQFLRPLADKARQLRPTIPAVTRFVGDAAVAVVLIVIGAVLLQALALAILVLSLVPLDAVRAVVGRLQRFASTSVGDLYIVLTSPTQRAALAGAVQRDVRWLRSRGCERVVVVAHSQGGFVAHQALTDPWHPPVDLFLTLGSGVIRLTESERARRTHMLVPALIGLLGFLILVRFGPTAVLGTFDASQRHPASGLAAELGFLMMLVLVIPARPYLARRRGGIQPPPAMAAMPEGSGWVDYLTADDPVVNGTRDGRLPAGVELVDVVNRGSVIADHGAYWDNTDQFVAKVALQIGRLDPGLALPIAGPLGTAAEVDAHLERSWQARLARVGVLERVRVTFAAAVIALIVGDWARLDAIGAPISRAIGGLPSFILSLGGPIVDALVPVAVSHATVLGAAAVAILGVVGYRLAVTAWDAWGDDDTASQWRGEPPDPLAAGAVAFHAWVATLFVIVALVAFFGPAGAVDSIGWVWGQRDPITQASAWLLIGSALVAVPGIVAIVQPRWPAIDEPRLAKAVAGCCFAVGGDVALAAAAPGRHPIFIVAGAVIAFLAIGFMLGPLRPLARAAADGGAWMRAHTDRPLVGRAAQPPDLLWVAALGCVVAMVPLAIQATGIAAVTGVAFGVAAVGSGIESSDRGQTRQIRTIGASAAMLGLTMAAVVAARWGVVNLGVG